MSSTPEPLFDITLPKTDAAIRTEQRRARRAHNLQVGLTLAAAGVKVFATLDKSPMVTAWEQDGDAMPAAQRKSIIETKRVAKGNPEYTPKFIGSTSDEKKVRLMHATFPDAVFSIALGPSRLICLDADLPKEKRPLHGPTELAKLYAENGGQPEGVFVNASQSGAEHHIFENPDAIRTSGSLAAQSIDIKGGGTTADSGTGQIVAPGSIRIDGKCYGTPDAAARFVKARKAGLAVLPEYIAVMAGKGADSASSDAPSVAPSGDNVATKTPEAEIATLANQLRSTPEPDVSRFDLVALQFANNRFADLMLDPADDSKASDRLSFLNHVVVAFPDITGVEAFALMKGNPDVCGKFVTGNQKKGEYDFRNAARDYLRAKHDNYTGAPVRDDLWNVVALDDYRSDERDDYQSKLKPVSAERSKELRAKLSELEAAHDARIKAREIAKAVEAEVINPTDSDATKAKKLSDKRSRLESKFYFGEQMMYRIMPKYEWAVKGVVARGTTTILAGRAGAGKTGAALDLAGHIALGLDWNGRRVQRGVVVYVALENPHLVEMRWRAWLSMMGPVLEANGLKATDASFVLYHAKLGLFEEKGKPTLDENDLIDIALLAAEHYGLPVAMVILDTVSKSIRPGNPTEHGAMYVQSMQRISEKTVRPGQDVEGANVMAIAHPPKSGSSNVGGSYAFEADTDTVLLAEPTGSKGVNSFVLKADEEKFRIGDPLKVVFNYRKTSVEIGIDEDGQPETVMLLDFAAANPMGDIDDDGDLPTFKMSDTVEDRRAAILEIFDIEARRQKADDQNVKDALRAVTLGPKVIAAVFNKGRRAVGLTDLGRSTISECISDMVKANILRNAGTLARPEYALASGAVK